MGRGIRAAKEDALISAGGAVIGDAATCTEQSQRFIDEVHVDGILWQVDFGSASRQAMTETLQRFAADVAPELLVSLPATSHTTIVKFD